MTAPLRPYQQAATEAIRAHPPQFQLPVGPGKPRMRPTPKKETPMYRIATMPTFDRETLAEGMKPARDNDGTLIIMHGDPNEDDTRRALLVPRVARVKRADAYSADDPAQMALAERVVALLNVGEPGTDAPSLPEAVGNYLAALEAFGMHPPDSGKAWTEKLYAKDDALAALRLAHAAVIPE